jgi:TetR/AcrR family tetracycline transcriptional repressor
LTDRLGVQRGALYWHVKSKHELLSAVAQLITRSVFVQDGYEGDWAAAFAEFAHRLRAAMLAHRDGARLIAGHIPQRPEDLESLQENLAKLAEHGIPPAVAARFGDTMASYVTGFVLQEQSAGQSDPDSAATFSASVNTIVLGMRAEIATLVP